MRALRFPLVLSALIFAAPPEPALAGDPSRELDEVTTGTSQSPDSDLGDPHTPDDDLAQSDDPDDDLAGSESPDADLADSEDSDDQEEGAASPDDPESVRPAAAPVKPLPKPSSCRAPVGEAAWAACLADANAQIEDARKRLDDAEAAYSRSVNFRIDLGSERAKIIADRDQARSDLSTAEERLPELVEAARRAGVGQRVLDPYQG